MIRITDAAKLVTAYRDRLRRAGKLEPIAERSGISIHTLRKLRNGGHRNPTVATLEALERGLSG